MPVNDRIPLVEQAIVGIECKYYISMGTLVCIVSITASLWLGVILDKPVVKHCEILKVLMLFE